MHEDLRRSTGRGQGVQILFTFRLYDAGEFYAAISSIKVVFYDQDLFSFCVCRHVHKIVKSDLSSLRPFPLSFCVEQISSHRTDFHKI
jgi:hypothetical protein